MPVAALKPAVHPPPGLPLDAIFYSWRQQGCNFGNQQGDNVIQITDLTKDIRKLLLEHWTEPEINQRLEDPEYFFNQVVTPRLKYLSQQGTPTPQIRFKRDPKGQPSVLLIP